MLKRIVVATVLGGVLVAPVANPEAFARTDDHAKAVSDFGTLEAQLLGVQRRLLEVPDADRAAFAELLAQPNTGIIRLLPREKYDGKLPVSGGGSYYSFARLTHEYGHGSDIGLEQGSLRVGFAGADWGLLADLGQVDIAAVTLESAGAAFLAAVEVPREEAMARASHRAGWAGHRTEGLVFKSTLPSEPGHTYVLRSINYDDSDVLVVFRVVRMDQDGSLVVAWRRLAEYPKPRLIRTPDPE